jgi:hypothetical protein
LLALTEGGELQLAQREGAVGAVLAVLSLHGGDFNLRLAASRLLHAAAATPEGSNALLADERGVTAMVGALGVSSAHGQDRELVLQTLELLSREERGQHSLAGDGPMPPARMPSLSAKS